MSLRSRQRPQKATCDARWTAAGGLPAKSGVNAARERSQHDLWYNLAGNDSWLEDATEHDVTI